MLKAVIRLFCVVSKVFCVVAKCFGRGLLGWFKWLALQNYRTDCSVGFLGILSGY